MLKDTSHPNFNIPPPKKRIKSKWCTGFILPKPAEAIDKYKAELYAKYRKHNPAKSRGQDNG